MNQGTGRPLRGPQASTRAPEHRAPEHRAPEQRAPEHRAPEHRAPEQRAPAPARGDDLAHLYRKIADLQADAADSEARAVKAEREQSEADSMLGQMLARVSEVEARLRAEQKLRVEGEAAAAQAAKLRASQAEMLERLQTLEAQAERARIELTHARREAATHRLAADDQLHLLAKEREDTAELLTRLEREQRDREALRARLVDLDRTTSERNDAAARARELQIELEATRQSMVTRERDLSAKLEQAWVEIRHAHDSADALEDQLADVRDKLTAERATAENARRELAAERALATEVEADIARLELASEAGERTLSAERARSTEVEANIARVALAKEVSERALAAERDHAMEIEADVARLERARETSERAREASERALTAERARAAEAEANVARLELAREAGERALTEARAEIARVRAAHESALGSLRESHIVELAEALSERSRRERGAVDAEIAAGRRDLIQLDEALAEARRQLDLERAATAEAESLLAGEREWVAEMEEDSLRREEDLEKTRRAQTRADALARAAEARRVELEDAFAEAERALASHRGDLEMLRVAGAMHRMRIAELERERELRADMIEVNAIPAEIERLRRRVASAEARAAQMHTELADAIDEVTHLLTELERREMDTARMRTQSLASARSLIEHVTAATRPVARPATSAHPPENTEPARGASEPPEAAIQAVDVVDEDTAERLPEPAEPADVAPSRPSAGPPPLPTAHVLSFPAAPPIVGLPSLTDVYEDEGTAVVDRDAVQPLPVSS
jgi:chemotaxis protein MotB